MATEEDPIAFADGQCTFIIRRCPRCKYNVKNAAKYEVCPRCEAEPEMARCKNNVVPGTQNCRHHGGLKAADPSPAAIHATLEKRFLALADKKYRQTVPAKVLKSRVGEMDAICRVWAQYIEARSQDPNATPFEPNTRDGASLTAYLKWVSATSTVAKQILDAQVAEREAAVTEAQQKTLARVLGNVIDAEEVSLSPMQRAAARSRLKQEFAALDSIKEK